MPSKQPKPAKKTDRTIKQFSAALKRADYKETNRLLQDNPWLLNEPIPIAKQRPDTTPPLRFAVNQSSEKIVKLLLDRGATVEELDAVEQTALFDAVFHSRIEMTTLLLQEGADPNQQDIHGLTPLHWAIKNPDRNAQHRLIKLLLAHGANPALGDNQRITPPHCATALGRQDLVALLTHSTAGPIHPAADTMATQTSLGAFDDRDLVAFQQCLQQETGDQSRLLLYVAGLDISPYHYVSELLKQGVSPDPVQPGENSALVEAVSNRCYELQKLLLDYGADPNRPGAQGNTPLMVAIMHHDQTSSRQILAYSVIPIDLTITNDQGDSVITLATHQHNGGHCTTFQDQLTDYEQQLEFQPSKLQQLAAAVTDGKLESIKDLLKQQPQLVRIHQKKSGNNLLMLATKKHAPKIIKVLLQNGANPNLTDTEGLTPLLWAASEGANTVLQVLLKDRKTRLDLCDNQGHSALWRAADQERVAIIQQLLEDKPRGITANPQLGQKELHATFQDQHLLALGSLLAGGVDPNQINPSGSTLWQQAANTANTGIIQLLLRNDQKPQDRLWWCFEQRHSDLFQQLLYHPGITVDQPNQQGVTLLQIAAKRGDLGSVKQLLAANADPQCVNPQGRSALALSVLSHQPQRFEVASLLLKQDETLIEQVDNQGRTPLLLAAECGDQPMVDWLLRAGANTEHCDQAGRSVLALTLLSSSKQQSIQIPEQLQKASAGLVDKADYQGQTPLMLAAKQGFLQMVEWLLSKHADPDCQDSTGRNVIIFAAQSQQAAADNIIQQLLALNNQKIKFDALQWALSHDHRMADRLYKSGFEYDLIDQHGQTLLLAATYHDNLCAVEKLLSYSTATLNQPNQIGQTALSYAAQKGYVAILRRLLKKGSDVNHCDQQGRSPLFWAIKEGHQQVVELLLESGASLTSDQLVERSLLIVAIKKNRADIVSKLLIGGADPNIADDQEITPLIWAVRKKSVTMVAALLEYKASLDATDRLHEKTALHWAVELGNREAVCALLPKSDPNKTDALGNTPLITAIKNQQPDIIKLLLLDCRVNCSIKNDDHQDAIDIAEGCNNLSLIQQIKKHASYPVKKEPPDPRYKKKAQQRKLQQLILAAEQNNLPLLQRLLEQGISPDQVYGGWHPLLAAAKAGHLVIVTTLLNQGANPNQAYKGWTAVMFAIDQQHSEVAQQLLKQPTTQIKGSDGHNHFPLLLAAKRGQLSILQDLLAKGADPNQQDDGPTALMVAAAAGHLDCVRELLNKGADPNQQTDIGRGWGGWTAIMYAVNSNRANTVNFLITSDKTNGDLKDGIGWTPLLWAIRKGYSEVAEILITSGRVDLNYHREGDTALTLAIRGRHIDLVQRLMEYSLNLRGIRANPCKELHEAFACLNTPNLTPEQSHQCFAILELLVPQLAVETLAALSPADKITITPITAKLGIHLESYVTVEAPLLPAAMGAWPCRASYGPRSFPNGSQPAPYYSYCLGTVEVSL